MTRKPRYNNEFKQEVLRMAETSDKSIAELERDLGLFPGLIRKWQQQYRVKGESIELVLSEERETEAEIRRLKRKLEIV